MTQNLIHIGNSQSVIIPKDMLKKLNFKNGEPFNMEIEDDNKIIISERSEIRTNPTISVEFLFWLDSFKKRYSSLTELASK